MKEFTEGDIVSVSHAGGVSTLICPRCGGDNLHQGSVRVFNRAEDEAKVWRTTVSEDSVETKIAVSLSSDNPSPRRHGISIGFQCENCGMERSDSDIVLHVYQHKGATLLRWYYARPGD